MKKIAVFSLLISLSLIFLAGCTGEGGPGEEPQVGQEQGEEIELTLEELSAFDGSNGNRAYIAVDGIIYDVTDSSRWRNGRHNGFQAGQDLTKQILEDSPHGVRTLNNVPAIGRLKEK